MPTILAAAERCGNRLGTLARGGAASPHRHGGLAPSPPDGCAVQLYAQLPPLGKPELVHAVVPAGASVLDLGCGTGRILRPLAALGHPVVGVDESAETLAHCRGLETVRALATRRRPTSHA